jgi:hypothetical protein
VPVLEEGEASEQVKTVEETADTIDTRVRAYVKLLMTSQVAAPRLSNINFLRCNNPFAKEFKAQTALIGPPNIIVILKLPMRGLANDPTLTDRRIYQSSKMHKLSIGALENTNFRFVTE